MEWLQTYGSTLLASGFTFLMTALGAGVVFFFRKKMPMQIQSVFLGFAAGVMIAASVWSLLIPAMDMSEHMGAFAWVPAAGGFFLGVGFLLLLDHILPHLHLNEDRPEGVKQSWKRTTLLVSAMTLHNIPEGMAIGLTFAMCQTGAMSVSLASAWALAIGVGLQNFPEGAAVSLPLKKEGVSNKKAFFLGAMSGIVEPIAAIIAVFLAGFLSTLMPWLLSFAAGAMMYVVVEELIPSAHLDSHNHAGTLGVLVGFVVMMILDVALS